mgnify:CR=1 FL=1
MKLFKEAKKKHWIFNKMKYYLKFIVLICLILQAGMAYAEFRDVNTDNIMGDIPVVSAPSKNAVPVSNNAVKDNNKKLYGVVGKSQILNFDTGIKRVSIADPNVADVVVISPKQLIVNGKKAGSTSLIFWSKTSTTPVFYNLSIQQDTDGFLEAVNYVAPNEDITIIFNNNGAVMSGFISSSSIREQIKNLAESYNIKLTDITESPTKQVLLEVRVTEISKNFTRDLGVQFGYGKDAKSLSEYLSGLIASNPLTKLNQIFSDGGFSYYLYNQNSKISATINAAEEKGDIKILPEPKLLAVNNEDASFNVGNEVPIPSEIGDNGNVSYDFKETGVILKFKPTIMEKTGRVRLKLSPEVSEIDRSAGIVTGDRTQVPGFKTRKVDTTVELMDGETLVIAGLLMSTSTKNKSQVPGLGNIPVLGVLFRNSENVTNDSELVIFITPKIVDNMSRVDDI